MCAPVIERCRFLFSELRPAIGNEVNAVSRSCLLKSIPRWKQVSIKMMEDKRRSKRCKGKIHMFLSVCLSLSVSLSFSFSVSVCLSLSHSKEMVKMVSINFCISKQFKRVFCYSGVPLVTVEEEEQVDSKVENDAGAQGVESGERADNVDNAINLPPEVEAVEKVKPEEGGEEEVKVFPKGGAPKKVEEATGGTASQDHKVKGHRKRVCCQICYLILIKMEFWDIRYLMLPKFFMISYYCNCLWSYNVT